MPSPALSQRVSYAIFYSVGLVIAAALVGFAALLLALVLMLGGKEQVTAYSIPKAAALDEKFPARKPIGGESEDSQPPQEPTDRMLTAIALRGEQAWFFKVTGPIEAVAKHEPAIAAFLEAIHFDGVDSPPQWKLPEAWKETPPSTGRFATLKIDADVPLELAISSLPNKGNDKGEYLLINVNRWREQMGLRRIPLRELAKTLKEVKLADATLYKVDLLGRASASMPGGAASGAPAPFSSGTQPPSSTNAPRPRENPAIGVDTPGVTFKAPQSWKAGRPSSMRKGSFLVQEGEGKSLDISIIPLDAKANNLLDNVNRWREQVKLKAIKEEDLPKNSRPIEAGGVKGHYVELFGAEEQAILGAVIFVGDKAWFVKLMGDAELARREKENFEAFVRSIEFKK